jgi:acyl carrier protein
MLEKLLKGLAEALEMEADDIHVEDTFRDYDNYDSLTELSILAMLDDQFGIEIEMSGYDRCMTVADLLALVESRS